MVAKTQYVRLTLYDIKHAQMALDGYVILPLTQYPYHFPSFAVSNLILSTMIMYYNTRISTHQNKVRSVLTANPHAFQAFFAFAS